GTIAMSTLLFHPHLAGLSRRLTPSGSFGIMLFVEELNKTFPRFVRRFYSIIYGVKSIISRGGRA
ncbi:MAG: hypothetical protein WC544_05245, partial [Patescibacteria group bacterium]